MASLYCSSARPTQSISGFLNLGGKPDSFSLKTLKFSSNLHSTPLNFRFKKALKLSISQRLLPLYSSNSHSEGTKTDAATAQQGPPFLTILAGFLVIFVVFWIVKSVVLWLLSLVFTFPGSK